MTSIALENVYSQKDDIILRATYFYFLITLNQTKSNEYVKQEKKNEPNIAK